MQTEAEDYRPFTSFKDVRNEFPIISSTGRPKETTQSPEAVSIWVSVKGIKLLRNILQRPNKNGQHLHDMDREIRTVSDAGAKRSSPIPSILTKVVRALIVA